ncbi:hypothetical protein PM082_006860 [Marasmius tenuissimus]|nr:hypothetical protein PM082_006860 [Marasmius tenuissimus]
MSWFPIHRGLSNISSTGKLYVDLTPSPSLSPSTPPHFDLKKKMNKARGRVSDLQKQLERSNLQHAKLQKAYDEMKGKADEHESLKKRSQALESEHEQLKTQFDSTSAELQQLKDRYIAQQLLLDQQTNELQEAQTYQNKIQLLETEHKQLKAHFDRQAKDVQQLMEKYGAQQALLDYRTRELQLAQADLTSTRSASGIIVRLVESLNSEILQVASSITDALPLDQSTPAGAADKQVVTAKYLGSIFGEEKIAAATYHPGEDDLDIIIQNALQYLMVSHCRDLIERWHVDPVVSKFLKEMYRHIRKNTNNPLSVAGRWRTMTKAETKYGRYDQVENYARTCIIESAP